MMAHDHYNHQQGVGVHQYGAAFAIGAALNIGYVVLEAGFGLVSGSLALLADAGHNLSDVLGLLLAWGASSLASRRPTSRRTYGYKRGPILASLINATILLIAVGAIIWEAIRRLLTPEPVASETIIWVAVTGVFVNAGTAWMFMSGRKDDLNIRGVFIHMAADAGVTVGVIIAALLIRWTEWQWLDPATSLLIAIVILVGSWGLLRDSINLVMDAVPPGIDQEAVGKYLRSLKEVSEIHDLHIWGLSTTDVAATMHIVRDNRSSDAALLREITDQLRSRFGIVHPTIQFETAEMAHECAFRPDEVV
jgi:cobalt-zinc-cadmium efflux system protein